MPENNVLIGILKPAIPFGFTICPYFCRQDKAGFLAVNERLTALSPESLLALHANAGELVALSESIEPQALVRKFSTKVMSPTDFFSKTDKKLIDSLIRPFFDKALSGIVELLKANDLKLFDSRQMPNLYPVDQFHIYHEKAEAKLKFRRSENGTLYSFEAMLTGHNVRLQHPSNIILTRDPCLFVSQNRVFAFDESINGKLLLPFLNKESLEIPTRMEAQYFSTFIKKIVNRCEIEAEGFTINEIKPEPHAMLSLERDWQGQAGLILKFGYGNKLLLANNPQKTITDLHSDDHGFVFNRLKRKPDWEKQQVKFLKTMGLKQFEATYRLISNGNPASIYELVNWITINHQQLSENGFTINQPEGGKYCFEPALISASLKTAVDWYDLHANVTIGEFVVPFYKFRDHILTNKREFSLPDGQLFVLPDEWFTRYREIMIFASERKGCLGLKKHHYRLLSKFNFPEIEKQLSLETGTEPFVLPVLTAISLRPYQVYGFGWMKRHSRQGFGCLLADDMGLGKTIQVIALLASYYSSVARPDAADEITLAGLRSADGSQLDIFAEPAQPEVKISKVPLSKETSREKLPCSLIVMPSSLIHNWLNEINRIAPALKVLIFTGSGRKLSKTIADRYHIVLTTYGTLRNDIEFLEGYRFGYIVLDESQSIKNALSKTALAASRLNGEHRVAMTGTPVENSLNDLWSQMNFLNPGMLGSLKAFNNFYASVLISNPNHEAGHNLLKIIEPFLLRRTKEEVATELPPVTETVSFCTMDEGQQELYEREKSKIRNYFLSGGEGESMSRSSVMVLRALMHLRQIANHPRMTDDTSELGSGKFEEVTGKLETILSENHKVLVFSSFVKHLNLLGSWCNEKGIRFAMLTGSTTSREKVVKSFKKDKGIQLFLISLKAGGVGLNLAEAGYVFILDPWWNPAAEMQAISRAHRIGQDKNVFVYRFISTGTVEEKIMQLQERKASLAQTFVRSDSSFAGLSSEEAMALFT
ncbi:MAG: DEAD/DEAH box helicase [Lentimicrobium sp.]|nr:DEAD/DEAH box helicase [Lentimicrobium sp.]